MSIAVDVFQTLSENDFESLLAAIDGHDGSHEMEQHSFPPSSSHKARIRARRCYCRRANRLRDLRDQAEELETKLQWLLKANEELLTSSDSNRSLRHELNDSNQTKEQWDRATLECLNRDMIHLRIRIQEENVALRKSLHHSVQRLRYTRDLLLADEKLYMADDWTFALLQPLTPVDCEEVRQQALDEFHAFTSNDRNVKPEGCTYGWQEKRFVDDGCVKFALTKTIYRHTAESISERTWQILDDPTRMAQMYSNTLQLQCHIVQKVDGDNIVLYQESRLPASPDRGDGANPVIIKSVMLLSRFQTPSSYFILLRGLPRKYFQIFETRRHDAMEDWTVQNAWIQAQPTGAKGEHCLSSFSGMTPIGGTDPKFWLAEVSLHVLRWEAAAVGIRFSLPSPRDP